MEFGTLQLSRLYIEIGLDFVLSLTEDGTDSMVGYEYTAELVNPRTKELLAEPTCTFSTRTVLVKLLKAATSLLEAEKDLQLNIFENDGTYIRRLFTAPVDIVEVAGVAS